MSIENVKLVTETKTLKTLSGIFTAKTYANGIDILQINKTNINKFKIDLKYILFYVRQGNMERKVSKLP